MASALEGTEKPLVTTSGTLMLMFAGITGRPGTEADYAAGGPRVDAENFVTGLAERGVRVTIVEREPYLGGRVGGWTEPSPAGDQGDLAMSRGFHAFFRQYYNLRALLRRADPG